LKEAHLILGIGELLWDILPSGPHLGGVPIDESLLPAHLQTKVDDGAELLLSASPTAAVSPAEALPIGPLGSASIEPIAPAGLPQPPRVALLGGAPANFSVMAGRLGNHAAILSRIGRDKLGRMAMEQLEAIPAKNGPIDTSFLQVDPEHETGCVTVEFVKNEPRYTIHEPAAWDFLSLSDEWVRLSERADAICFGSLAQRSVASRQTIQNLAAETRATCVRVFDVNLRPPFVSAEVIQESLELATVVKMNDDELPQVLQLLGLPAEDARNSENQRKGAARLLAEFPSLQIVAVTRGSRGSLLATREEWNDHPGFPVKIADGIGAGDAFTAAMTHYMLRGAPLATLNEAGNRWGGWVASQSGAMPALPDSVREAIAAAIEN
jgi:fructokinase